MKPDITIHAVGDVFINRPAPAEVFSLVAGVIGSADIVFGNCEVPFSRAGATTHDTSFVADGAAAAGLRAARFNVMSCANNHIGDEGPDQLLQTLAILREQGIATSGAGPNKAAARRPAIIKTPCDCKVAVLSYASFFRYADVATADRPGITVVGGETIYAPPKGYCSPGVAPTMTSVSDPADVAAMVEDIRSARAQADLVLCSFHWGDATRPAVLTDHEHRVARHAIDAGAHGIFGHHHHVLRGIDFHGGMPVFYGLGNFVWDAPPGWAEAFSPQARERMNRLGKYAIRPRAGYPRLPFHPDSRMTMISRCRYRDGKLIWSGFIPCVIRPDGLVEPHDARSAKGQQVTSFVRETCEDLQLAVAMEPDDAEKIEGFTPVRVTRVAAVDAA